jgi:hypothetical protein
MIDEGGWRSFYDGDAPSWNGFAFLAITTQIIGLWRATFYYNHSLKPASLFSSRK